MKLKHQIPFHMNQDKTFTIFYDEAEKLFYRKYTKTNVDPIYLYSGVTVSITYPILSGLTYNFFSGKPVLPMIISFLAAVVFLLLTIYLSKKHLNKASVHYFDIQNSDRLYLLIVEGERLLQIHSFMVVVNLLLNIGLMVALFTHPNDFVLFLCHTIFWWIFFILIYFTKPFKRRKLYRELRNQLDGAD